MATASGKRITVGVAGGPLTYLACDLVHQLVAQGMEVHCILTTDACRYVTPLTFELLTGNPVHVDTFERGADQRIHHIVLGQETDALVVAPATAQTLAQVAHSIADDMLASTLVAATCPILLCTALDDVMVQHPAVQDNIQRVSSRGIGVVTLEPSQGVQDIVARLRRMVEGA